MKIADKILGHYSGNDIIIFNQTIDYQNHYQLVTKYRCMIETLKMLLTTGSGFEG